MKSPIKQSLLEIDRLPQFIFRTVLSIGISFLLISCSNKRIRSSLISQELLFPLGTYQHRIQVETTPIKERDSKKKYTFNGLVQIRKDAIQVSVLSPIGTTLLKLYDDRKSGKLETVSYMESLKKHEGKFKDYYSLMKLLLMSPRNPAATDRLRVVQRGENGNPEVIETVGLNQKSMFMMRKYDHNNIPEKIEMKHPKYTVFIQVTSYDLLRKLEI